MEQMRNELAPLWLVTGVWPVVHPQLRLIGLKLTFDVLSRCYIYAVT